MCWPIISASPLDIKPGEYEVVLAPEAVATVAVFLTVLVLLGASPALAQDEDAGAAGGQSAETKALDSTATQWSFQFAYQWMPDYYDDVLDNGLPRPAGLDNYLQLRIVAPVVFEGSADKTTWVPLGAMEDPPRSKPVP